MLKFEFVTDKSVVVLLKVNNEPLTSVACTFVIERPATVPLKRPTYPLRLSKYTAENEPLLNEPDPAKRIPFVELLKLADETLRLDVVPEISKTVPPLVPFTSVSVRPLTTPARLKRVPETLLISIWLSVALVSMPPASTETPFVFPFRVTELRPSVVRLPALPISTACAKLLRTVLETERPEIVEFTNRPVPVEDEPDKVRQLRFTFELETRMTGSDVLAASIVVLAEASP